MTIVADSLVKYRYYRGWQDPRLPAGVWFGQVTVTGDASGGNEVARIVFRQAISAGNQLFYSLESYQTNLSSTGSVSQLLESSNWTEGDGVTNWRTVNRMIAAAGVAAISFENHFFMPFFLGTNFLPAIQTTLELTDGNVLNEVLELYATGYFWTAQGQNLEGGIRRPPGSILGR